MLVRKLLQQGHRVKLLARSMEKLPKGCDAVYGDLSNTEVIDKGIKGCDVVFHVASLIDYTVPWSRIYEVNVRGTKNIVDVCVKHGVKRLVYMGSTSVYGNPPLETPTSEDSPTNPTDLYGKSKLDAERVLNEYMWQLPITILRPSVIYGPTYLDVYGNVLKLLEEGRLPILGDGKNVVPFVHADDVADLAILCGRSEPKRAEGIFNVCENKHLTQEQVYEIACAALNVHLKKKHADPRLAKAFILLSSILKKRGLGAEHIDVLAGHRIFDTGRAERELGWSPKILLSDGIKNMVALYRNENKRKG